MLLVRGHGGGTALTGTIFERGEEAPTYRGAPNEDAPYVWVCDEFYEVESGGSKMEIDGHSIRVAFDTPLPRGFDTREQALDAAKEHIRTQFARIGVPEDDVRIEVVRPEEEG
ncbi:hypothetical protein E6P09_14910 [Haloferax mediterranei ATCC 33500]|uniref:Uncharacterized protein n=1 Tax=Haloferax mediterranei (strain ATCC 33500 / DSM 1411 / JCM 8866 / NBRC 14739 / NCIMB 2177 / R-4) TaxID=523841 RepID=I3R751_HALMT|nr:hypothetical protein [Haloferax mediterranei]AFK20061.1 hypothetical protein HFX_2375 [Haloferax mediterranei ATCC 33500]AHZ23438.1 hypothetical protein BM92_12665 [Haloferax mediterranei ATCC 33500]ELZ99609.1 hypothetical protein C439_13684 [Haloferax mediterranei ATCC 33500]MDX5987187.1 hypothetical protein [Haloferax mediterranei ATCC 33500]QCQ76493.1 hypothetical protein E6P09_14910 [Haloferax mediterranei ATCC 33500]